MEPRSPLTRLLASCLRLTSALALLAASGPGLAAAQDEATGARSREFRWAMEEGDLGQIALPAETEDGWMTGIENVRFREVPSFSGDPTFEVVLGPGLSGHPERSERFMIQFPHDFLARGVEERAVVVAFHSFSVSEKQIFLHTDLPELCTEKGWMLIAPYGLDDINYANAGSQEAVSSVLRFVYGLIPFNYRRIYSVGFSMGALNALSYAMRRLDPFDAQVAGVVFHSGPVDLLRAFANASTDLKLLLSDENHFGGPPDSRRFAYERVSPALMTPEGSVDPDHAPVSNLLHIPIYIHANLADPDTELLAQVLELKRYLIQRGATVFEDLAFDPYLGHAWETLSLREALETIEPHSLPGITKQADLYADGERRYLYADVRAQEPDTHARFEVELTPDHLTTPNAFSVTRCANIQTLAFELPRMRLDPKKPLSLEYSSREFTEITYILVGYEEPPSVVFYSGGGLRSWRHDASKKELSIRVQSGVHASVLDILP